MHMLNFFETVRMQTFLRFVSYYKKVKVSVEAKTVPIGQKRERRRPAITKKALKIRVLVLIHLYFFQIQFFHSKKMYVTITSIESSSSCCALSLVDVGGYYGPSDLICCRPKQIHRCHSCWLSKISQPRYSSSSRTSSAVKLALYFWFCITCPRYESLRSLIRFKTSFCSSYAVGRLRWLRGKSMSF